MDASKQLDAFFSQHPKIPYATPKSPDYSEQRRTWYGHEGPTPLSIARPQTASDVATIVSFATISNIPFTVRVGGHDSFHRAFAADSLCLDLRDIDYVHIDPGKTTARIGGGILQGALATELAKEGLATSTGSVPSVGYVGWAVCGGYGRFSGTFGMGVDQIVGAKVVDYRGGVVEADGDMLRFIRGGGGMVGVIVEVTIRVYPLEKILAGRIAFDSTDLAATIKSFATNYRALEKSGFPAPLHLLPVVVNTPFGKLFMLAFTWSSSDFATGRKYVSLISSWGTVIQNTVEETNIPDWQEESTKAIPSRMFGIYNQKSCRVYELTDEVAEVVAEWAARMPDDPATLTGIHTLRDDALEPIQKDSVFKVRKSHFLIEMLSTVTEPEPERLEEAKKWCQGYLDALLKTEPGNVEKAQYFTHTSPEDADLPAMYGEFWEVLVAAKKKYDPKNVFRSGPVFQ